VAKKKTKTSKKKPAKKAKPKAKKKFLRDKVAPKKVHPDGTFETAIAYLNQNEVAYYQDNECVGEVGVDRHWEDRPTISSFKLPFTAEDWLDLMNKEGEFLGMCCATISNARDILLSQLREDQTISCAETFQFIELLGSHDSFEWLRSDDEPDDSVVDKAKNPIYRLWKVWQVIKPHANLLRSDRPKIEPNKNPDFMHPVHEALGVAHRGIDALYFAVGCFGRGQPDDPEWMKQQQIASRKLIIARTLPSLRAVLDHISHLDLGDYDGFAICSSKEPSHVVSNRLGHCIFQNADEAQKMIDAWAKPEDHEKEPPAHREKIRSSVVVRPVRVSTEKGVVFTDGNDTPNLEFRAVEIEDDEECDDEDD
jgi:hypothetical protein